MERRQVLTTAAAPTPEAAAAAAEAGTLLGKLVADASRSDDRKAAGSKETSKREVDRATTDGEDARLSYLVHAGSCAAVDSSSDRGARFHAAGKKEGESSRVVTGMGSLTLGGLPSPLLTIAVAQSGGRRRKKLLILDLNGLLADINQDRHNAHLSHGTIRGKLVFKRPFCDDFLRFCMHHFELGIWSSRLRANVDAAVGILMEDDVKQRLLFCWDLSKCTGTGSYTLENKAKPLVLKELKKLWGKQADLLPWQQGEFSPSNTLLLDDSPYKALRNPPHTAIFPCPYSYKQNDKDDALGPGGDLRLYLASLATADDVQRYVREHPFGQPPITEAHPHWEFYRRILATTTRVEAASSQGMHGGGRASTYQG